MGNRVIALAQLIIPRRKINLLLCTQNFMAHCGRLNVCANQLGKCDIFEWPFSMGSPSPSPSVSMHVYFLRLRYDQSINWTTTTTSMTLFSGDNVVSSLAALGLFWHLRTKTAAMRTLRCEDPIRTRVVSLNDTIWPLSLLLLLFPFFPFVLNRLPIFVYISSI